MSKFPNTDGVGAIESPDGVIRARRRKPWLAPLGAVAVAVLGGSWLLADRCGTAQQRDEIEALTADGHEFVRLVRSSLPPQWSIERVVEFPTLRPGSGALAGLRDQRAQARVNLEQKTERLVAKADRPDLSVWARWISQPTWMSRADVVTTAATLRRLDAAIARLRADVGLAPAPLRLDGTPPPDVPATIPLPALPAGLELIGTRVWTLPPAAVVMRFARRHGECRARQSFCVHYHVTWVSWDGGVIDDQVVASPPDSVSHFEAHPGITGTVYAIAVDAADAEVAAYAPRREPVRRRTVVPAIHTEPSSRRDYLHTDLVTTHDGARLDVQRRDAVLSYRLAPDGAIEPVADGVVDSYTVGAGVLDKRGGASAPFMLADGSKLVVQRKGDAVYAAVTAPEATAPESVTRLADYTDHDEQLFRGLHGTDDRIALVLEGGEGALSVLLSTDGGRSWTGAPDGDDGG